MRTRVVRTVRFGGSGRPEGLHYMAVVALLALLAVPRVEGHKPVLSKYTFSEDVYPILKDHCGGCHVSGGIAPMSLLTYEDTRPWAESIRLELTTGHMPPWYGDPSVTPLRDVHMLSARDLDVVLTWASGGTPPGPPLRAAAPSTSRRWPHGRPDLVIPVAAGVTLPADKAEDTREFVLRESADRDRMIALADVQPGNPAIVHDAIVFTRRAGGTEPDVIVRTWLPGAAPVAPGAGLGFAWRAGDQLVVRMHYKKNWTLENKVASDRSTIGLYFAAAPGTRSIREVTLRPGEAAAFDAHVRGIAVGADAVGGDARIDVDAVRPDGTRVSVAGFSARPGWSQRYWFARPVDLPKGTRLEVKTPPRVRVWLDAAPAS